MLDYKISWNEIQKKEIIIKANSQEQAFQIWDDSDQKLLEEATVKVEVGDLEIEER